MSKIEEAIREEGGFAEQMMLGIYDFIMKKNKYYIPQGNLHKYSTIQQSRHLYYQHLMQDNRFRVFAIKEETDIYVKHKESEPYIKDCFETVLLVKKIMTKNNYQRSYSQAEIRQLVENELT